MQDVYSMGERIDQTLDTLGFNSIFAKVSAVYTTKKIFDLRRGICDKVTGWFSKGRDAKIKVTTNNNGRSARPRYQRRNNSHNTRGPQNQRNLIS